MSDGLGNDSTYDQRLQISEAGRKQNAFKSLARFSTQFRVKESFKFGDKSRNSLTAKATLNFSGSCRRVRLGPLN